MEEEIGTFYSALADHYHLIFEDWDASISRQAAVLNSIVRSKIPRHPLRILDCACGIGTQALGFASGGHSVVGSDLSPAAIHRARREAESRNIQIEYHVADMTSLEGIERGFDVAAALDNALPHLTPQQLSRALSAIASKLRPKGLFLASIRDYDALLQTRPASQGPSFYGDEANRRIVHQIWDWIDEKNYRLHLFITCRERSGWESHHFVSTYRCLLREELSAALTGAGFAEVEWLMPAESAYYQPIVLARKS